MTGPPYHGRTHDPEHGTDPIRALLGMLKWNSENDVPTTRWFRGITTDSIDVDFGLRGWVFGDQSGDGFLFIIDAGGGQTALRIDQDRIRLVTNVGGDTFLEADATLGVRASLSAGQSLTVIDSAADPIMELEEATGDLHLKVGANVVMDL